MIDNGFGSLSSSGRLEPRAGFSELRSKLRKKVKADRDCLPTRTLKAGGGGGWEEGWPLRCWSAVGRVQGLILPDEIYVYKRSFAYVCEQSAVKRLEMEHHVLKRITSDFTRP